MLGMSHQTTVHLSDGLKAAVTRSPLLHGCSEAAVIRAVIAAAVGSPLLRASLLEAEPFADRADELLEGFVTR